MTLVYIAGPMRGFRFYNFPEFDKAERFLEDLGYDVFNPADLDRELGADPAKLPDDWDWNELPEELDLDDIIARDLEWLRQCEAIYMLDGWERSKGARAELATAEWLGLEVLYQTPPGCIKDGNPKDSIGSKKAGLGSVPGGVMLELGLALKEGAHKYGAHNWRVAGVSARIYYEACLRHMVAWWEGEDIDPDSGLPHPVKAMACIAILRDAERQGMLTDDRPVKSAPFIDELNSWAAALVEKYPNPVAPYTERGAF